MSRKIYLDHNASTPIDPRVLEKMVKCLEDHVGNPSSVHCYGQQAKQLISEARQKIARYLGVRSHEVVFTSGGTEGIVSLIRGIMHHKGKNAHLVTSELEHSCVYQTAKELEKEGYKVTFLSGGLYGAIKPEQVEGVITKNTSLIALMSVNNETGVKTDVKGISKVARKHKIPFFVDAVCQLGKENIVIDEGISALAFSGHKFHAPKGIGAVYVKKGVKWQPYITGGNQEFGRRGGTENLPGIVALGEAIDILNEVQEKAQQKMERLRNHLESEIIKMFPGVALINGQGPRACNTSNLSFVGLDGESILIQLDLEGLMVSHGSACYAGAIEPSRILLNMGISREVAQSSIRISLSRMTTDDEIQEAIKVFKDVIGRLIKLGLQVR